jgi:hypothetical protein
MNRTRIAAIAIFASLTSVSPVAALEPDPPKQLISMSEGLAIGVRDRLAAPQNVVERGAIRVIGTRWRNSTLPAQIYPCGSPIPD